MNPEVLVIVNGKVLPPEQAREELLRTVDIRRYAHLDRIAKSKEQA